MNNETGNQNYSLVLITRPSLQATALLHQIKSIVEVNAKIHNINKYLNNPTEKTLFLFDLMEADKRSTVLWQTELGRYQEKNKLLLLNTPEDYQFQDISSWPNISAVFYLSMDESCLVEGIKSVMNGEYYFSQRVASYLISQSTHYRYHNTESTGLTNREKEILNKLRVGASNTEIARLLFISENTVKTHLYNLFKKISVKNRTQAVSWANDNLRR